MTNSALSIIQTFLITFDTTIIPNVYLKMVPSLIDTSSKFPPKIWHFVHFVQNCYGFSWLPWHHSEFFWLPTSLLPLDLVCDLPQNLQLSTALCCYIYVTAHVSIVAYTVGNLLRLWASEGTHCRVQYLMFMLEFTFSLFPSVG